MTSMDKYWSEMTPVMYQSELCAAAQRIAVQVNLLQERPLTRSVETLRMLVEETDKLWYIVCRSRPGVELKPRDGHAHFMPADPVDTDLPA